MTAVLRRDQRQEMCLQDSCRDEIAGRGWNAWREEVLEREDAVGSVDP